MKNLKSILALLLALVMVLSLAACGGNSAEDTKAPAADDTKAPAADDDTTAAPADDTTASGLDWLNLGGVTPIVDEGVEKTLSLCLPISDETVDTYKERWQYIYTTEVKNVNLDVMAVPSSAWGEKLPLILADVDNLPDLIMNTGFSTGDLLRYGAEEGLLVDIAPYINDQYMPCLASLFADHPEYKVPWTTSDGNVWGVGFISHVDRPDEMQWHYLNYQWMEDCGLDPAKDLPTTLDEFTDLMRKFKEVKSAEFGEEIYPISGKYTGWNSIYRYLLAACGFVGSNRTDDFPGGAINMRNGKVTLPVADREGYEGFIKTLKLWYDEGLVHPEYFTGDSQAIEALVSAGKTGYTTVPPFIWVGSEPERLGEWWGAPLLSSEWCDQPGVPSNAAANGGPRHVITTACEELELALAFYDWFFQRGDTCYNQNQFVDNHGVYEECTELAEKYPQFVLAKMKEGENANVYEHIVDTDKYVDANDMLTKCVALWGNVAIGYACIDDAEGKTMMPASKANMELYDKYIGNYAQSAELSPEVRAKNMQAVPYVIFNSQYRVAANEEFPAVTYFDAETQEIKDDLYVALKEYATTETAKFITGERDLAELPDYFDEMDALGAQEYIQIHQDYFDAVVGG